ncbi:hypothetical protein BD410DRAFT_787109 [Rickenella mellea]|uniref:Uncharacterized protein n=1 Tax=Rickenella mellea TaxID=50990 RepID=A0A4Y7Q938_9AGAM|nr:hypothetical protein BD410DRAFT_787109 [Rickenella mellea]
MPRLGKWHNNMPARRKHTIMMVKREKSKKLILSLFVTVQCLGESQRSPTIDSAWSDKSLSRYYLPAWRRRCFGHRGHPASTTLNPSQNVSDCVKTPERRAVINRP